MIPHQRRRFAAEAVEQIAGGPEGASERHEVVAHVVDVDEHLPRGAVEGLVFEGFQPVAKLLQHWKITIDRHIEQQGAEGIGPLVANAGAAMANPPAHSLEGIAGLPLPKRDDIAIPQKETDRIGDDRVSLVANRSGGNEHLMAENLDLRPLIGRDGIFQGQFADIEHGPHHTGGFGIIEPLHIDPDHGPFLPGHSQFLGPQHGRLFADLAIAGQHAQRGGVSCRHRR